MEFDFVGLQFLFFPKGFIGFNSLLNMKTASSLNMFSCSLLDENS